MTAPVIRSGDPEIALALAADEGWNPADDDAERFAAADPAGFLVAELAGEPVGTVSLVRHDDHHAFLGLFIVRPDLRGTGIGRQLFAAALERAGTRVTGLDGVVEQQAYYARMGFAHRHANRRWQGAGAGKAPAAAGLVDARAVPFEELASYDAAVFSSRREAFLRGWIDRPPGAALALVRDGAITGLGVLRSCRVGAKVGPLFADDAAGAAVLLDALLHAAGEGEPVTVDVPDVNAEAVALVTERGMQPVFETARMERGGAVATDWRRTFGVTTLELG